MMPDDDDPSWPKSRFRINANRIIPIFALLISLFAVLALRKGCANGVATMFKALGPPPDARVVTPPVSPPP